MERAVGGSGQLRQVCSSAIVACRAVTVHISWFPKRPHVGNLSKAAQLSFWALALSDPLLLCLRELSVAGSYVPYEVLPHRGLEVCMGAAQWDLEAASRAAISVLL